MPRPLPFVVPLLLAAAALPLAPLGAGAQAPTPSAASDSALARRERETGAADGAAVAVLERHWGRFAVGAAGGVPIGFLGGAALIDPRVGVVGVSAGAGIASLGLVRGRRDADPILPAGAWSDAYRAGYEEGFREGRRRARHRAVGYGVAAGGALGLGLFVLFVAGLSGET